MDRDAFSQARQFIARDIGRELALAKASPENLSRAGVPSGGGNFLAALGLLSYTEFAGRVKYDCRRSDGNENASENFNRFFDDLGSDYRTFRHQHRVYDVFRCGLVHEYYVKRSCVVAMFGGNGRPGIGVAADRTYFFIVDVYFRDLDKALADLETSLFR